MSPLLPCRCGCPRVGERFSVQDGIRLVCADCGVESKPAATEEQAHQFWNAMMIRHSSEKKRK